MRDSSVLTAAAVRLEGSGADRLAIAAREDPFLRDIVADIVEATRSVPGSARNRLPAFFPLETPRQVRRLVLALLGTVILLPVAALLALVVSSEARLTDVEEPPAFTHPIPADSAGIAVGRHLTRTRGCFGCHGQRLEGQVFTDEWPWVRRAVAPNLAEYARAQDASTLEAAIRRGIGHDGRALWSMPSYNFVHLGDGEVAAIIAFLRSAPVAESDLPRPSLGLRARWAMVRGAETNMAEWVGAVPPLVTHPDEPPDIRRGERLAMTTCNECHGLDLRGAWAAPDVAPPDLAIVSAYPWQSFLRLMQEGLPMDDRPDLGLMTVVARDRFAHFTDQELGDLYAFLQTLPARPVPEGVFWRPTGSPPN